MFSAKICKLLTMRCVFLRFHSPVDSDVEKSSCTRVTRVTRSREVPPLPVEVMAFGTLMYLYALYHVRSQYNYIIALKLKARSHSAFFSDCDCDSFHRNKWVTWDSMEVFTLCDCDNITNSYAAHCKQK